MKAIIDDTVQTSLFEKIRIKNSYQGKEAEDRNRLFLLQQSDIALRVPVKAIASFHGVTRQSLRRIRRQIR